MHGSVPLLVTSRIHWIPFGMRGLSQNQSPPYSSRCWQKDSSSPTAFSIGEGPVLGASKTHPPPLSSSLTFRMLEPLNHQLTDSLQLDWPWIAE